MKTRIAKHLAYLFLVFSLSIVLFSFVGERGGCDGSTTADCKVTLSGGGVIEGKGAGWLEQTPN